MSTMVARRLNATSAPAPVAVAAAAVAAPAVAGPAPAAARPVATAVPAGERLQCPKCGLRETERGQVIGWHCKVCGWRERR
jgi:hypothetical protein